MALNRSQALMKYTLILANTLIIVYVWVKTIRGLLIMNQMLTSFGDTMSDNNLSTTNDKTDITAKDNKHQTIYLIIESIVSTFIAILGLWAGIEQSFALLIIYGIVLIVSIVVGITVSLGSEQHINESLFENYSVGIFHVIVGALLALLAFRMACITKSGVDNVESESEIQQEDQQNQCEIV